MNVGGPPEDDRSAVGVGVENVRRELAQHAHFATISGQIAEANEKTCEAKPVAGSDASLMPGAQGWGRRDRA